MIVHNHNARDFPHFSSKITKNNCLEKSPLVKYRRLHSQTSHLIHDYLITRRFSLHVSIVGLEMKKMGLRRISDCPYSSFRIIYYISPILNGWSFNSLTVDFRILITPGNVFPIWLEFQTVVAYSFSDFIQMCGHYNVSVYQECCRVVAGYFLK